MGLPVGDFRLAGRDVHFEEIHLLTKNSRLLVGCIDW